MKHNDKAMRALIESMPDRAREIEAAYAGSSRFRVVCRDFDACARALAHWESTSSAEASAHREEYRQLLGELRQEAIEWLNTRKDPS